MSFMPGAPADLSNLRLLARRIEGEIRSRSLREGERFMTTEEVGQMLGVSSATAHRALNYLVKRKLLIRQHGRGTFIGPNAGTTRRVELQTVYVLLPDDQREFASVELDDMVEAIRSHVGRVNVQLSFLPSENTVDYVRELIAMAQRMRQFAGAIPISCPREVYRYLSDSGTPTVVLGSLYRDQQHLPSVDVDYHQAGKLLADNLLRAGHRRLALLATAGGRPGDDAFYDGVSDALTRAALPHNSLVVRMFPHDFDAFRAQIEELMTSPDRPSGIICRSERLVGVVAATVTAAGLSSPGDVDIVFQTQSRRGSARTPYAYVRPKEPFRRIADELAVMLKRVREGQALQRERVIIPVELCFPNGAESGA
jgi:DNA-binding LacI/PurR family transcriptional regulator